MGLTSTETVRGLQGETKSIAAISPVIPVGQLVEYARSLKLGLFGPMFMILPKHHYSSFLIVKDFL